MREPEWTELFVLVRQLIEREPWFGRKMNEELTKPHVQRTKLTETPTAEDLISGWQSEQSAKRRSVRTISHSIHLLGENM